MRRAVPRGSAPLDPAPPGPRSRELCDRLAAVEAPVVSGVVGGRCPIVWRSARGSRVADVDGHSYLDLTAGFGVAAVGHAHPRVVAAVRRQAGRLLHGFGDVHPHEVRVELAARLAGLAPVRDARVYFAASGSEAVEIALKSALLATGRPSVAAFTGGYHGLTHGALRATWRPEFRRPFRRALGRPALRLPFPHPYRPPLGARPGELGPVCLEETRALLRRASRRGALPGAVIVEPVQGREGVVVPPRGWLRDLARLCRELGVLLVADEVYTGFGRTGTLFAVERERVRPDLLVVGKALGGGLPIAAAVGGADLLHAWDRDGEALHTSTFLAHPLSCAGALAALDVLERDGLAQRAGRLGRLVGADLHRLAAQHEGVGDVRGAGLMWGIELVRPGRGSVAAADRRRARAVSEACLRRGVLILAGGPSGNVLQVTPPLVLRESEWRRARRALGEALDETG